MTVQSAARVCNDCSSMLAEMKINCVQATLIFFCACMPQNPDKEFFFVIGTDLVKNVHTWPAPGVENAGLKLVQENKFLVVNRPGYDVPDELPENFIRLQPAEGDILKLVGETISSSEVRARLKPTNSAIRSISGFSNGDEERAAIETGHFARAEGLVPSAVLAHIIRYRLYQYHDPVVDQSMASP